MNISSFNMKGSAGSLVAGNFRKPAYTVILSGIVQKVAVMFSAQATNQITDIVTFGAWAFNRMKFLMFLIGCKNKIFNSVVIPLAVYVVNVLRGFKNSTYLFFHYKAMLENSSSMLVCKWMLSIQNANITTRHFVPTTPIHFMSLRVITYKNTPTGAALLFSFRMLHHKFCSALETACGFSVSIFVSFCFCHLTSIQGDFLS